MTHSSRLRGLLLTAVLLCMGAIGVQAQCPGGMGPWLYRVPITINNPGSALTNYFLLIKVNTSVPIAQTKMRVDGGDIRFTDGNCVLQNFWTQNGLNTSTTTFWVKAASVPNGTSTFYMYYGNPGATRTNQSADVFGNGLIALYSFTEGSGGTLTDWIGGINLNVTATWGASFRSGVGALTGFNTGGRAFIAASGPAVGTGSFTVIDYINPTSANGSTQGIVGNYATDGTSGWVHKLQGGAGQFMLLTNQTGGWCQASVGSLTNNAWQMSGVRRNAGVTNNGFQNGAVTGGAFCAGDNRNLDNAAGPFEIGHSYNNSYAFQGSISMTLIYNVSLSDGEVAAIHQGIFANPEPTVTIGAEETVAPPVITSHPTSQALCAGGSVTFSCSATGIAITYQWRKNGAPIPFATNPTYTINNVQASDNGVYDCLIRNQVATNPATLTVWLPPGVLESPVSHVVCPGEGVILGVAATGTSITYQWRKDGNPIPGATGTQYVIPGVAPDDDGVYDVVVTGVCDPPAVSGSATVDLRMPPVLISATGDQSVCRGEIATFSVVAEGEGLTYQWRKDGVPIDGANSPTLNVATQPYSTGYFDVVISGTCEPAVTSPAARLTVDLDPIITEQPISQTINPGNSVTFQVKVIGGGILSYQWQKDGINIPGANNSTYTINDVSSEDIGEYSVLVRGTICSEFEPTVSNRASLILNVPPIFVKHPENISVCEGEDGVLTVTAGGLGLTYQWRKNGTPIPGANGRDLLIEGATSADAASYDVVITGSGAPTPMTSNAATVTVNTAATVSTQPQDAVICVGETAQFNVAVNGSGVLYQWRKNGVDIPNAVSATFEIPNATEADTGAYSVVITAACTEELASSEAQLVLNQKTQITEEPATPINAPKDGTVILTIAATGTNLTYQWRKDGAPIPGATTATYTINNAQPVQSGSYDVIVSGACEPADTSAVSIVNVATTSVPNYDVTTGAALTVVPHPATGMTRMTIRLPQGVHAGNGATLMLYDGTGKAVLDLSGAFERGGYQTAEFNASQLSSGVYYCKLSTGSFTATLGSIVVAR